MALSVIKNGQVVEAPDTAENEVKFDDSVKKIAPITTWWIEVISGSIQFASDEVVTEDHHAWAAGSKVPMTVHHKLHYKAGSAGDSFVVTV